MKDQSLFMKLLIPQILLLVTIITLIIAVIVLAALSDRNVLSLTISLLLLIIATIILLVFSWNAYHQALPQRAYLFTYIPFILTVLYLLYIVYQLLILFGAAL